MPFINTIFPDLLIFEPKVFGDSRGYFYEAYNEKTFHDAGIMNLFIQDNQSSSCYGVIRGLHFQTPPFSQAKLVRVIYGSILDVAVDIRVGSPTFGRSFSLELSAENKKQLMIPKGFAHGFSVLSETAEVMYKCDALYNKESDNGINLEDTSLEIDWQVPRDKWILSDKDKVLPFMKDYQSNFIF